MSDKHDTVEYRTLPEFPNYRVGSDGTVLSNRRGRWKALKPGTAKSGYQVVVLCNDVEQKSVNVHRLVLEAFVGPCPDGMECCHNDGDRSNNGLDNLRWDTHSENCQDASRHGTLLGVRGEQNHNSKLTEGDVNSIRAAFADGESPTQIAARFGISRRYVYSLAQREWRKHA